ncbi:DUF6427 family protein [Hufsiella ginkgonis]|uniref:Beta-carotene 15,15'-monooxygenase n=1 Tax=Hufsiella ginkgonis TaxID=2695274 RepID=A0A7K1XU10_9SPHI|nr:DUF6427 family protein [Hufsiella ginkgonis]MXV14440.1 beta-carotene 15,15'-monooxygenase [Hufsiella ginkgonis]
MINQFRTLSPLNLAILAVATLVFRIGLFYHLPGSLPLHITDPLEKLMIRVPGSLSVSATSNILIAAAITFCQGLLVNKMVNDYNLMGRPSFLPALLYVTAASLLTPFLTLSLPLIGNFFVIWIAYKFLSLYRSDSAGPVMYDLGMIVGAATLVYFPFIAMVPLLWISLIIFRPFNWREWFAVLMGFITIYFFLGFIYYWNDVTEKFYRIWLPLTNKFTLGIQLNLYDYIVFIPLLIIFALSLLTIQQKVFRGYVQTRKSFQALFAMLILAIVSFYLEPDSGISHFQLAAVPVSVFLAYYFSHARIRWFYEALYMLLAGCVIYFQWF